LEALTGLFAVWFDLPPTSDLLVRRVGDILVAQPKITCNELARRLNLTRATAWKAKQKYLAQKAERSEKVPDAAHRVGVDGRAPPKRRRAAG
jgi:hypothetical protein